MELFVTILVGIWSVFVIGFFIRLAINLLTADIHRLPRDW